MKGNITVAACLAVAWTSAATACSPVQQYPEPPAGSYSPKRFTLVEEDGKSAVVDGAEVSADFFAAAQARPLMGRLFIGEEYRDAPTPVALVSHQCWEQRFGSDPGLIGRVLSLDDRRRTVVGVLPRGVDYPKGSCVWLPRRVDAVADDREARERPPQIVLIHRDALNPGSETTYRAIEEDAARICADLKCPHPHFALESLTKPKEVWWINAFESEAQKQKAIADYKANGPLTSALEGITKRREGLLSMDEETFASYKADLSRGDAWRIAGVRFFEVTVTKGKPRAEGAVFEAPDGTRFIFRALSARDEAGAVAAAGSPEAAVFAVRPYWGFPAKEWIAADPEFWKPNPAVTGAGGGAPAQKKQ
jgi:MacB-like periplasmic core domain